MEGRTVCKFFQKGNCRKGASCTFAHESNQMDMGDQSNKRSMGMNEPRICEFFLEGNCKHPKCHSIHAYSANLDHVILDDEFHMKPIVGMSQISNRINNIKILKSL